MYLFNIFQNTYTKNKVFENHEHNYIFCNKLKEFKNYYKKLMQQVLKDNPNAHVIAFLPLQDTTAYYSQKWKNCWKAIENIVQNFNNSRVSVFPKGGYDLDDN